ncbi:MAG: FtsX-like permease family protein [Nitrososphaerota archaeon]|nr:FtsX-like permease family protein [Nitrososphaerota archaeon]
MKGLQIGRFQSSLIGFSTLIVAANSSGLLITAESNKWYLASIVAFVSLLIFITLIVRNLINEHNQGVQIFKILGAKRRILIGSMLIEWALVGMVSSIIGSMLGLLITASSSQTFFERLINMPIIEVTKSVIFVSSLCMMGMAIGIVVGVYLVWNR